MEDRVVPKMPVDSEEEIFINSNLGRNYALVNLLTADELLAKHFGPKHEIRILLKEFIDKLE